MNVIYVQHGIIPRLVFQVALPTIFTHLRDLFCRLEPKRSLTSRVVVPFDSAELTWECAEGSGPSTREMVASRAAVTAKDDAKSNPCNILKSKVMLRTKYDLHSLEICASV